MAVPGLFLISHLIQHALDVPEDLPLDLVELLAYYTDSQEPWASAEAEYIANDILSECLTRADAACPGSSKKSLNALLKDKIKPLFSKGNISITKQARKLIGTIPRPAFLTESNVELKPWKTDAAPNLTLLKWILQKLDVCLRPPMSRL